MAGEWLKFEANTPEKPEVFAITLAMGWDDPDLTVGKLLKVWRWFDQQTIDGNAPSVSFSLLDRISGVSGFAQAMANVGWLCVEGGGVCLPNFDRHNGKTAKDRAQTAKRVAKHKTNGEGNAKGNAPSVSSALPREEKRREEKEKRESRFAQFWDAYPNKAGKEAAIKAFAKVNPDDDLLQTLLTSIARARESKAWVKDDGEFIPHASTWLNGKRWEDEAGGGSAKPWEL
jgi:hypothetical protein